MAIPARRATAALARVDAADTYRWAGFALVALVVNGHSVRHLSLILYAALYGVVTIALTVAFVTRRTWRGLDMRGLLIWCAVAASGAVVSTVIIGLGPAIYGLVRFLFAVPVFLALAVFTRDWRDVKVHAVTITTVFAIGSLTLPMQFITGEIAWFGGSSERAGFERFTSILGGLTALGYAVGGYVVLTQASKPWLRILQWLAVISASFASLSKAAIANVGVAALAIVWTYRRQPKTMALAGGGLGVIVGAALILPSVRDRLIASLQSFGIVIGDPPPNFDHSFGESIWSRLAEYPVANYEALADLGSWAVYVFGGGFGFASTALVPVSASLAPMAHNQFAELLTVFGPVGAFAMLVSLFVTWRGLSRLSVPNDSLPSLLRAAFWVVMLNAVLANGVFYQPASATLLYFLFFVGAWTTHRSPGEPPIQGGPGQRRLAGQGT